MSGLFFPGTQIGRYRLEDEVGRGGMGVVYRARDPMLGRPVALKLLAPHLGGDQAALARFHREAALIASLKHTHIATVYEFGEHEGRPYIALEWITGRTLKELLAAEGRLPVERSLGLFDQLAGALDYAHRHGVIHRDLKPANIMIGTDDKATIVDFGLAWLETAPSITTSGMTVGTPRYMSPEQVQGESTDGRSDLYSLAVIFYEMLAGRPPFDHPGTAALFYQQLYAPPPPITEYNPSLPAAIENALSRALAKDPDERFSTAAALGVALREESPPALPKHAPSTKLLSFIKRRGWLLAAVTILGLALSIVALTLPGFRQHEATPTRSAPTPASTSTAGPAVRSLAPGEHALWPMIGGSATHAGFIAEEWSPPNPKPRWVFDPQSSAGTGLVAGGGRVVFGVGGGAVRGLDWATGEPAWETSFGANVSALPTIYPDFGNMLVFVPTDDGELYALALTDRQFIWRIGAAELGGAIPSGVSVGSEGAVYIATASGKLHILDPSVGKVFSTFDVSEDDAFRQPPTVTNVAIYLSGERHAVYALDRAPQDIAWIAQTVGQPTMAPVAAEAWGFVLVGTDKGWVHAFSMITGKAAWQAKADSAIVGLASDPERLYAVSANGTVYAWAGRSGEEAWTLSMGSAAGVGPITNGKYVVVGTEAGEVRYIAAENGVENADVKLALGESITYPPAPAGDWLFVRTDKTVYGFGP